MSASCPFCNLYMALPELELHVNDHLVEDELTRDLELAHQIAMAPSSPTTAAKGVCKPSSLGGFTQGDPETSTSRSFRSNHSSYESHRREKISCLISLQIRGIYYKVEGGLMTLLKKCLEMESENSRSIISCHVDHFQSIEREDSGWGCGWRNIQMLSSHLLMQRQEARRVMFGGSGFVPDIPSLQRWLEIAWESGFDVFGSDEFNHKIYGSTKWIGTTECATLFRLFGLRSRIVDFGSKVVESLSRSVHDTRRVPEAIGVNVKGKRIFKQVKGPIDKFLVSGNHRPFGVDPIKHGNSGHASTLVEEHLPTNVHSSGYLMEDHDKSNKSLKNKVNVHQILVDWVWNYFSNKSVTTSGNCQRVIISEKMPLYFQHDGHSRTIVGIQVQRRPDGTPLQYFLLILDPGHKTIALERSLRENIGWQKLIKRGLHTLKKPQYQLCYVDPGIASNEEMEQLKTLDSIFFEA